VTWSYWSSDKSDDISICDRPGGLEAVHLLLRIKLKNSLTVVSDGHHRATRADDKAVRMQKAPLNFPVYDLCVVSWI